MLKLLGTLRNGPSRLSSRSTSWCMPNHQLLAGCSGAVATQPSVSSEAPRNRIREENVESVPHSSDNTLESSTKSKNRLVNRAFAELNITQHSSDKQMKKNKSVEELLSVIDTKYVSYKQALHTITLLSQHVEKGKIDLKELEADLRYQKFCKIIIKKSQAGNAIKSMDWEGEKSLYSVDDLQESANVKLLPIAQTIQMFCGLAVRQRRPKPLLRGLAENIMQSATSLSFKHMADVLYSMAKLNFVDEQLLGKLSEELRKKVPVVSQSPIIGSILTSLGMMRYRDEALMDTLCDWSIQHKSTLRTQDLCALLMTLAVIGYSPRNFNVLYPDLVANLKETDMIKVAEWVDVVWSLVVLNQVSNDQVASTLNEKFIAKLGDQDTIPVAKKHKLLNINAAAKYLLKNYSGPLLKDDSPVFDAPIARLKDKEIFVKAITDALANLFPSRDHFRTDVDARTGFLIDIEFFIDQKLTTLPVNKARDTKAFRIAITANYYHDFCVGKRTVLGSVLLHNRLLEATGYRILNISHTDFHTDDKLLKRISYLNDRIKLIVK